MPTQREILAELDEVFRGEVTNGYHVRRIAGQAAELLRRYEDLLRWANDNCQACGDGRPLPHPQPIPLPDQTISNDLERGR